MVMPVVRQYTLADLADLPDDGKRYELIRGDGSAGQANALPGAWGGDLLGSRSRGVSIDLAWLFAGLTN